MFLIGFPRAQDVMDQGKNGMGHCDYGWRLLSTRLRGDTPESVFQETTLFPRRRPRRLGQCAVQRGIPAGGAAAFVLVRTAVVPGADGGPRAEMFRKRKRAHIASDLSQYVGR